MNFAKFKRNAALTWYSTDELAWAHVGIAAAKVEKTAKPKAQNCTTQRAARSVLVARSWCCNLTVNPFVQFKTFTQ